MTIEKRETFLFGVIKRDPEDIPPGSNCVVWESGKNSFGFTVLSPDEIWVNNNGRPFYLSHFGMKDRYQREEINRYNVHNSQGILDRIIGHRVEYHWREDPETTQ